MINEGDLVRMVRDYVSIGNEYTLKKGDVGRVLSVKDYHTKSIHWFRIDKTRKQWMVDRRTGETSNGDKYIEKL